MDTVALGLYKKLKKPKKTAMTPFIKEKTKPAESSNNEYYYIPTEGPEILELNVLSVVDGRGWANGRIPIECTNAKAVHNTLKWCNGGNGTDLPKLRLRHRELKLLVGATQSGNAVKLRINQLCEARTHPENNCIPLHRYIENCEKGTPNVRHIPVDHYIVRTPRDLNLLNINPTANKTNWSLMFYGFIANSKEGGLRSFRPSLKTTDDILESSEKSRYAQLRVRIGPIEYIILDFHSDLRIPILPCTALTEESVDELLSHIQNEVLMAHMLSVKLLNYDIIYLKRREFCEFRFATDGMKGLMCKIRALNYEEYSNFDLTYDTYEISICMFSHRELDFITLAKAQPPPTSIVTKSMILQFDKSRPTTTRKDFVPAFDVDVM
ncbi:hypothetical protein GQR58_019374 [Nymphon striatum]|nr:hypothetical protein GQR58_019374 [Nymphon striatum]